MSGESLPYRRLLPSPVETSVRSSKGVDGKNSKSITQESPSEDWKPTTGTTDMATPAKPRRFVPQPVEESTRRSHKKDIDHGVNAEDGPPPSTIKPPHADDPTEPGHSTTRPPTSTHRRFAPQAVETTSRSSRRKFAPEPVETTTRSSKDTDKPEATEKPKRRFAPQLIETDTISSKAEATEKPKRRFAPQLVETDTVSSKERKDNIDDTGNRPRRKFAVEPVETETRSRRRKERDPSPEYGAEDGPAVESAEKSSQAPSRTSSGGRRFSPELLETAKGTYRQEVIKSHSKPPSTASPSSSPERESGDEVAPLQESRFSAAALAKRHQTIERQRSFMVTDLPTIESDPSDDESDAPSLTNSRSSAESEQRQNSKRALGDSYTDYVLRLAAQDDNEHELKEQAMAAYVNERIHEPVAHYGFEEDEEGTIRVGRLSAEKGKDIRTFRRSSQDDLDWEMQNMRKHHAQLEEAKRQFKNDTAGHSRFSAAALATRHHQQEHKVKKPRAGEEDAELKKMRAAASPPMLGDNLVFPQSISPKMTRCDPDHPPRPRTNDSDEEEDGDGQGNQNMWSPQTKIHTEATAGLWMGVCQQPDSPVHSRALQTPLRSGIQTPAHEPVNPFEGHGMWGGQKTPKKRGPRPFSGFNLMPLTPPRSSDSDDAFTSSLDKKLMLEKQIEEEFPDRVVTQIYNYLSLGYPTLAWSFDEELSKISKISVDDLRKDDEQMDAKGYIGAPESSNGHEEADVSNGRCMRWSALRVYVREWARQSPNFLSDSDILQGKVRGGLGFGMGVGARRGSWGH